MATFVPTQRDVERSWYVIDANSQVLGRVATVAAQLLQGKHKPRYTPFLDLGDHVVIINAERVRLTGRKEGQKLYRQHSGYQGWTSRGAGGGCSPTATDPLSWSERCEACCPRRNSATRCTENSKCMRGSTHPHAAQKPIDVRGELSVAVDYYGTGRRKTSTARVFLRPGTGAVTINRTSLEAHFPTDSLRTRITEPLVLCEVTQKFDIFATAAGGGILRTSGRASTRYREGAAQDRPRASPTAEEGRAAHA